MSTTVLSVILHFRRLGRSLVEFWAEDAPGLDAETFELRLDTWERMGCPSSIVVTVEPHRQVSA